MTNTTIFDEIDREPAQPKAKIDPPGFQRDRWGIFPDVDIAAYHAGFIPELTLSQGGMQRLLFETPLDFAYNNLQINPDSEKLAATVAQARGDIVHQLALGKGKGYAVGDFKDWRTNEAKTFRERAIADGLTPCKRSEFEEAEQMAALIRERIHEFLDGANYETECAFLYQEMTSHGPIWVRGLMDVWCEELGIIIDPKISAMLYDDKVGRHFLSMGWDRQAALYPHAVGQIKPELDGRVRFFDLMIKPEPPYTSRFVSLERAWHHMAVRQCVEAMEAFGRCVKEGRWPGFEEPAIIPMPVWEAKRREAAEAGEI